jgi:Flp pilus assembly protein TadD
MYGGLPWIPLGGNESYNNGDYREAIYYFRKVLELKPNDS